MKYPKPSKRSKPSKKREYQKIRKIFLDYHPKCERCGAKAAEVHHRKRRGKYLLATETWMAVCHDCHVHIENNPQESYENGWLLKRNGKIEE